jgi:hypothetical protein
MPRPSGRFFVKPLPEHVCRISIPHSFRNTLVQLGQKVCKTPEQFKALSQNLGHEKVLTTFLSYGEVACQRQGEIIRNLTAPQKTAPIDADEIAEAVCKRLLSSKMEV